MTTEKPYGLWASGLSASAMAGDLGLKDVAWAGEHTLVWLESRDGHGVLCAREVPGTVSEGANTVPGTVSDRALRDITGDLRVSGGVGYGGGEFSTHQQDIFFAASDARIYRSAISHGKPRALIPAMSSPGSGVAAPTVSANGRWVAYIHTDQSVDTLAVVDARGEYWPQKLVSGADFYMQPVWSPDSKKLAWVSWNHPNMPWDQTQLFVGELQNDPDDSGLPIFGKSAAGKSEGKDEEQDKSQQKIKQIAPEHQASLMEPRFSPDGKTLSFISDEDGWWQLYLYDFARDTTRQLTRGEFEIGGPAWVQGVRAYVWKPDGSGLFAIRNQRGKMDLLDVALDGSFKPVEALKDYEYLAQPAISSDGKLALIASASQIPTRVITWDSTRPEDFQIQRRSSSERLRRDELAAMRPVSWQSEDGRFEIHGNYYPPTNPAFSSGGKPPAIVTIHGGPTAQSVASYSPASQFFATRGFAVLEVNYRGSTGYGRDYRHALKGNWGVYDVEDAKTGAKFLVDEGLADPARLVISGGSAGGYTVFQSLVENPGTFAAGLCRYGISNLFALSMETHKFESHYNDALVGVLPRDAELFRARSPLYHADRIRDAVAIFQGGKDRVVPPNQAEMMVDVLKANGVTHAYHLYPEEGHGWRRAETIEQYYCAALEFLTQYVIFS